MTLRARRWWCPDALLAPSSLGVDAFAAYERLRRTVAVVRVHLGLATAAPWRARPPCQLPIGCAGLAPANAHLGDFGASTSVPPKMAKVTASRSPGPDRAVHGFAASGQQRICVF
jgi:hypothetical protein